MPRETNMTSPTTVTVEKAEPPDDLEQRKRIFGQLYLTGAERLTRKELNQETAIDIGKAG